MVWAAAYLPYGEAQVQPNSTITNNLRFPGQYYDEETDLHYNWNRYYDPVLGRYLSPDPIGLEGGLNLYGYVNGDPVNGVDLEGLSPADVVILLNISKHFTDQLTRNGERIDPGIINNLLISCRVLGICENEYNGCGGQSDALKDFLDNYINNKKFDDKWNIEKIYNFPVHYNLKATSSNPNDPVLILDPHAYKFGAK